MLDPWFIQTGNTLIAQLLEKADNGYYRLPPEIVEIEGYGIAKIEDMKFHQSWDWIIPIAKKINMDVNFFSYDLNKFYENVVYELQEKLRK